MFLQPPHFTNVKLRKLSFVGVLQATKVKVFGLWFFAHMQIKTILWIHHVRQVRIFVLLNQRTNLVKIIEMIVSRDPVTTQF